MKKALALKKKFDYFSKYKNLKKMLVSEAKKEYRRKLLSFPQPVSQENTDWAWLWYLKNLHEETGDLQVFRLYMKKPASIGFSLLCDFIHEKSDPITFIEGSRWQVGIEYVNILISAGLVDKISYLYNITAEEIHLEMLKAYLPLRGLDLSVEENIKLIETNCYTIWFRFIEKTHEIYNLPKVSDLKDILYLSSGSNARKVLESNDFSAFAMQDETEREEYRAILEPEIIELKKK